ncbi:MAG: hypothetical protein K2H75_08655, partial [Muribaculaceae bacterium]|nr:hypothetical protein [Muribaculaceae bacterium]
MKKLSLWLSMSVAALFCSVAASGAVDGVRVSDGKESVVFSFMSTPTVTFGDATLYVTSEDGSVEFPMTSEVTFDFVEG